MSEGDTPMVCSFVPSSPKRPANSSCQSPPQGVSPRGPRVLLRGPRAAGVSVFMRRCAAHLSLRLPSAAKGAGHMSIWWEVEAVKLSTTWIALSAGILRDTTTTPGSPTAPLEAIPRGDRYRLGMRSNSAYRLSAGKTRKRNTPLLDGSRSW